ncbi:hypothetical protein BW43_02903 [Pseudomonas sp. RIT357]|nr:hypothetical protein BW43_02903 [Pseudomonas sp. RIT357]
MLTISRDPLFAVRGANELVKGLPHVRIQVGLTQGAGLQGGHEHVAEPTPAAAACARGLIPVMGQCVLCGNGQCRTQILDQRLDHRHLQLFAGQARQFQAFGRYVREVVIDTVRLTEIQWPDTGEVIEDDVHQWLKRPALSRLRDCQVRKGQVNAQRGVAFAQGVAEQGLDQGHEARAGGELAADGLDG